jgi:hypothetical protein
VETTGILVHSSTIYTGLNSCFSTIQIYFISQWFQDDHINHLQKRTWTLKNIPCAIATVIRRGFTDVCWSNLWTKTVFLLLNTCNDFLFSLARLSDHYASAGMTSSSETCLPKKTTNDITSFQIWNIRPFSMGNANEIYDPRRGTPIKHSSSRVGRLYYREDLSPTNVFSSLAYKKPKS